MAKRASIGLATERAAQVTKWAGIGLAAGLEKDTDGLGAVGGYRELAKYTDLGGTLMVFALPN